MILFSAGLDYDADTADGILGVKVRQVHNVDASNLPKFLSLIGKQNWWGQKGRCQLFVKQGDAITLESALVEFDSPVRPPV
jgi:hypothetical protein